MESWDKLSTKLQAAWSYVVADGKRANETAAVEKNRLNTAAEQKNLLADNDVDNVLQ